MKKAYELYYMQLQEREGPAHFTKHGGLKSSELLVCSEIIKL